MISSASKQARFSSPTPRPSTVETGKIGHEYLDGFQGHELHVQWVLFHGVAVRNNGIQKSPELRLGFAHRTISFARLSDDPTVLGVEGEQRPRETRGLSVLLLEVVQSTRRLLPVATGVAQTFERGRKACTLPSRVIGPSPWFLLANKNVGERLCWPSFVAQRCLDL